MGRSRPRPARRSCTLSLGRILAVKFADAAQRRWEQRWLQTAVIGLVALVVGIIWLVTGPVGRGVFLVLAGGLIVGWAWFRLRPAGRRQQRGGRNTTKREPPFAVTPETPPSCSGAAGT